MSLNDDQHFLFEIIHIKTHDLDGIVAGKLDGDGFHFTHDNSIPG
jgi:hypothetical protein